MAFEKIVQIGDREVTIFELTVKQVREMAKGVGDGSGADPLGNWLIEDAPFPVMAAMSSVDVETLEEWRPSEIKDLAAACREVNPDFFDMNRRLNTLVESLRSKTST